MPLRSQCTAQVRFAILDEADRMLSDGFEEDVERILETSPSERQTLLFSATMPTWVRTNPRLFLLLMSMSSRFQGSIHVSHLCLCCERLSQQTVEAGLCR